MIKKLLLTLLLLVPLSAQASVMRAADFLDTWGVGVHFSSSNTYRDIPSIASGLSYIGVKHVRFDLSTSSDAENRAILLGHLGIRYSLIMRGVPTDYGNNFTMMVPYLDYIEGPNEPDLESFTYAGHTAGITSAAYLQPLLYAAIKASWPNVLVLEFSAGYATQTALAGDLTAYADYGNYHCYPGPRNPSNSLATVRSQITDITGKPLIATEAGYTTVTYATAITSGGSQGVSELAQSKYELGTWFDHARVGDFRTYIYELADEITDPGMTNKEWHYGLFRSDWTPKPIATGIHNLHMILKDSNRTFTTYDPGITVSGAGVYSLTFEKADGSYWVAIWNEVSIWDTNNHVDLTVSPTTITLNSGTLLAIYDPLVSSNPIATSGPITLVDHPLILRISP